MEMLTCSPASRSDNRWNGIFPSAHTESWVVTGLSASSDVLRFGEMLGDQSGT